MSTNSKYSFKNINISNSLFMIATPVIAIAGTLYWLYTDGFDTRILWLALAFSFLTGMGITAGYHRLFSHRSYQASWPVRLLLLLFGAAAWQNSALKWCDDHRVHHGKVDTDEDPYNINEGFFYAHMGWILLKEDKNEYKYSKDLLRDPMILFQHRYYILLATLVSFLLPAILGYYIADSFVGGLFVAGVARVVFVHHCTFLINSLCHVVGTRPYDKTQTARDSWIMALFTYGEGYHNFHHTFQSDYRNGIKWYHFDPTKWAIRGLSFLGLTWNLKRTRRELILSKYNP